MRINILYSLILMCILAAMPYVSSGSSVAAYVTVGCPFSVQMHTLPVYPQGSVITVNYTIKTIAQCSISNLNGYFSLAESGNNELNTSQSVSTVSQTPSTYPININTNTLPTGNYTAEIYFKNSGFSDSSSSNFKLLPPANLVITSLATGPANLTSPIYIYLTVNNSGYYAANSIKLNLSVTGPESSSITQTLSSLSPAQSENTVIIMDNATSLPGKYHVEANVTYSSNNALVKTSDSTTYVVKGRSSSVGPAPTTSGGVVSQIRKSQLVSSIPNVNIVSSPLYISTTSGQAVMSILGFQGSVSGNTTVFMQVPKEYSGILSLSADSMRLSENETQYVQMMFNPVSISPGTYLIPLNITEIAPNGNSANKTEYFEFVSYSQKTLSSSLPVLVSQQVQIINSSSAAQTTITITSLSNATITNATLYTSIPLSVGNLSQISAYGLPNNITATNLGYTIKWSIPMLLPNEPIYTYYNIKKPNDQLSLSRIQNIFTAPSTATKSSILDVIGIKAPILYQNSSGVIEVSALYTGTSDSQIKCALSNIQDMTVPNPALYINATPNELVNCDFNIMAKNITGTFPLMLTIYVQGFEYNESVPVVILPSQINSVSSYSSNYSILSFLGTYEPELISGGIIALIIIVIFIAIRIIFSLPRDDEYTRNRMIRIRDQIRRSEGESEDA